MGPNEALDRCIAAGFFCLVLEGFPQTNTTAYMNVHPNVIQLILSEKKLLFFLLPQWHSLIGFQ